MKQGEAKEALGNLIKEIEHPQIKFRYCEKLDVMRPGQVCKVCGLFRFFDEDKNIEGAGMCEFCQEQQDELEEMEKREKPLTAEEEDLITEPK